MTEKEALVPGKGTVSALAKLLPWKKLRRYELANLSFEVSALYFAVSWALHAHNEAIAAITIIAVVLLGLACIMWACKQ